MIDAEGYRPNVGIILSNAHGQLLWARRFGHDAWQFPQGGIQQAESPEEAMFRELWEEVGLVSEDVRIISTTRGWLRYRLPRRFLRVDTQPLCIGQKQKWFLLQMNAEDHRVNLQMSTPPEFDGWRWVSYWYPLHQVVAFKREVYRKALTEFAPRLLLP